MKKLTVSPIVAAISVCFLTGTAYAVEFSIKNNSPFYLHVKDGDAGCRLNKVIEPNDPKNPKDPKSFITAKDAYWCGYVACATNEFDPDKGCLEKPSDRTKKELAEGGYATWFSISFGGKTCGIPEGNPYKCAIGPDGFTLEFTPVDQKYSVGPNKGSLVKFKKPVTYSTGPALRGVNISGLEYDGTFLDALYQLPDLPDAKYFVEQGMNTIRLPIRWEFVLSDTKENLVESHNPMSKNLNTMYLAALKGTEATKNAPAMKGVVEKYLEAGLYVVLDLHNYMRFCPTGAADGQGNEPTDPVVNGCTVMGEKEFAYIWGVLADQFASLAKKYPDHLIFELVNEPFVHVDRQTNKPVPGQIIKTEELLKTQVAAIKVIRSKGLSNYIFLSGNYWDPLHGWVNERPIEGDKPNGEVFTAENLKAAGVTDLSRIAIDMHQYFDFNYSGIHQECKKFKDQKEFNEVMALQDKDGKDIFGEWMKKNEMKVFLGEFGASTDQNCQDDLNFMLKYVHDHAYNPEKPKEGGFIGWTVWRANRHGGGAGFAPFNFIQDEDYTVYGAQGTKDASSPGTGIARGQGYDLMKQVYSNYLTKQNQHD